MKNLLYWLALSLEQAVADGDWNRVAMLSKVLRLRLEELHCARDSRVVTGQTPY